MLSSKSVCVNHDTLLLKLNFYVITDLVNKLLESYLKNRLQTVLIDNKPMQYFSTWQPVSDGPLLFLLYINYLPMSILDTFNPILFAETQV